MTDCGGWSIKARAAQRLGLLRGLSRAVPVKRRARGAADAAMQRSLVASSAAGNGSLSGLDALRGDEVGKRLLGLSQAPSGRLGRLAVAAGQGRGSGIVGHRRDAGSAGGAGGGAARGVEAGLRAGVPRWPPIIEGDGYRGGRGVGMVRSVGVTPPAGSLANRAIPDRPPGYRPGCPERRVTAGPCPEIARFAAAALSRHGYRAAQAAPLTASKHST